MTLAEKCMIVLGNALFDRQLPGRIWRDVDSWAPEEVARAEVPFLIHWKRRVGSYMFTADLAWSSVSTAIDTYGVSDIRAFLVATYHQTRAVFANANPGSRVSGHAVIPYVECADGTGYIPLHLMVFLIWYNMNRDNPLLYEAFGRACGRRGRQNLIDMLDATPDPANWRKYMEWFSAQALLLETFKILQQLERGV